MSNIEEPSETSGQKIGQYVRYQRNKRKWTIAQLAKRSTLTSAYISRLERGEYDSPSVDAVTKIAVAFQMPVSALLAKSDTIPIAEIDLPDLPYYLHEKLQLPPEAVDDVELFLKFITEKYVNDIERFKKESAHYWKPQ